MLVSSAHRRGLVAASRCSDLGRAAYAGLVYIVPVRASVLIAVAASLAACGNRPSEKKEPTRDAPRARRVIAPSPDRVGPLPPYAIRADGVGPYKLGEKLSDLLERLASGPRIALFEIPGVVHRNVIRAEDDTILIGGEQASTASFVAVVGSDVARTESGIHVGSTRDDVIAALGPPADDPERARDPRLFVPAAVPSLRAVLEDDRVAAIVVASGTAVVRRTTDCQRPPSTGKAIGACLTAAGELVEASATEIVVRSADGDRPLAPPLRLPGVVFAAPLHSAVDVRDELVVITRSDEAASRTWWLAAYRLDGGRLMRTIDAAPLYQLSTANARWIGADLRDIELYLELTSRPDSIEVGGLLTTLGATRTATKIRDVVVIAPASVQRKRTKAVQLEAGDASVSGAGSISGSGSVPPTFSGAPSGSGSASSVAGSGSGSVFGSPSSPSRTGHVMSDAASGTPDAAGAESQATEP